MYRNSILIILVVLFAGLETRAQKSTLDTSLLNPMVQFGYAYQFPGGDMKKRFGSNSAVDGAFGIKFKSGLYAGFQGSFLFGRTVKEDDILNNITTKSGNIIDNGGELGRIYLDERGYSLFLVAGKLFPVLSPNKNSGFLVTAGAGMLQHKIRMDYRDSQFPNLDPDYRKGYDRLSNGPAVRGFLGYIYLSDYRLINFYAGFDYVQAWTENKRGYNFDTGEYDRTKRVDVLTGIRVGWILPLYRRQPDEYYIY